MQNVRFILLDFFRSWSCFRHCLLVLVLIPDLAIAQSCPAGSTYAGAECFTNAEYYCSDRFSDPDVFGVNPEDAGAFGTRYTLCRNSTYCVPPKVLSQSGGSCDDPEQESCATGQVDIGNGCERACHGNQVLLANVETGQNFCGGNSDVFESDSRNAFENSGGDPDDFGCESTSTIGADASPAVVCGSSSNRAAYTNTGGTNDGSGLSGGSGYSGGGVGGGSGSGGNGAPSSSTTTENQDGSEATVDSTVQELDDGHTVQTDVTSVVNADGSVDQNITIIERDPSGAVVSIRSKDGDGEGFSDEEGKEDNYAGGGEGCASPPVCNGDPIQCAQLKQIWLSRCSGDGEFSPDVFDNDIDGFGDVNGRFFESVSEAPVAQALGGVADVVSLSTPQCPALTIDLTEVFGQEISTEIHCDLMDNIRGVIELVFSAVWVFVAFRVFASA